ncbi:MULTISPECIES: hypothetical protein [unclassified Pseudomonas]|uniref:hypothetical protein n=1 Tax=unclassified Pseudomonas TaxID=196821 RepID=UPI00244A1787|nr:MULTISPECIES: hypothetical protein [unclassified Pseudomonas]MDH0895698.1 hypothetical protein [Pseudomonas sp. GD03875]MDH1065434.1 hypothetical protein [Pseudomonas sp. GD03985]
MALSAAIAAVRRAGPFWLAFVVLLSAALVVRLCMPFEFPVPWRDETAFIAQAYALSTDGTFFVDALNAERVVMWMPPGYMLLLAGVFEVFGYSFDTARWVSTLCYLSSAALALALLRQLGLPGRYLWLALAATLLAFLSPYTLAASNIARMEALYTALFLASLLALLKGRPGLGLALVLVSATVHFNAVYMLLPYAVLVLWTILRRQTLTLHATDLLALVLAVAALVGYGLMVAGNLAGFIEDMKFQFAFKSLGEPMGGRSGWMKLGLALLLAGGQLLHSRRFGTSVMLSLYGAAFMALALNGQSMWYDFAFVLADWLLVLSVLATLAGEDRRWLRLCGLLLTAVLSLILLAHGYGKREYFAALWPRTELVTRSLLAPAEIERIRHWIGELPEGTRVSFGYTGVEPFFFDELHRAGVTWSGTRHNVTRVLPIRKDDFRVVCDSALYPTYLFAWDLSPLREGGDTGCRIIKLTN